MFWKFLISILLLPSCLGFEVAAASIKNEVPTLPKSEEWASISQKQVNPNFASLSPTLTEDSTILSDRKAENSELHYQTLNQPYLIAHHYRDCYHQGYYRHSYYSYHHYYRPRYYLRGYFYPDNVQYHRSYYHRNYYRPSGYGYYHHNYYRPSGYGHYYHNYYHRCGGYCGHSYHGYY